MNSGNRDTKVPPGSENKDIKESSNKAKLYQLVLFPMNNGATNVYHILIMNFIAYYANGVLGLFLIFATTMVTVMRLFDAVTDPIIGALIDRTSGKFGKFRPYMAMGNLIMLISSILLYFGTRVISENLAWLKYVCFVLFYMLYVIGYTFQTACTRSGQTCLTNDPNQRPLFTVFNTIASLGGMGLIQFLAPFLGERVGGYNRAAFFDVMIPLAILVSAVLTMLAIIGIWEKDRPEYFGVGGTKEKVPWKEYLAILKENKELQRLMAAGAACKLATTIATNMAVLCMLYGAMMGNYNGLYFMMMVVGYVFSIPFFFLTVRTSQKYGQKKSLVRYTRFALLMYLGVLVLLLLWKPGNVFTRLNLSKMNVYTILFILFYGCGYGAYFATADMPIPMVADCSDYETYRSGRYIPGIIGTLFSLVDKLVSSLGSTIVGVAVTLIGIHTLPDGNTPYAPGMHGIVILLFCAVPMAAWIVTLLVMKGYTLNGEKMRKIQEVNARRKEAVSNGMSLERAMEEWK